MRETGAVYRDHRFFRFSSSMLRNYRLAGFTQVSRQTITRSSAARRGSIRDASRPRPIWQARVSPPPIDAGILTAGSPRVPAVDLELRGRGCCAYFRTVRGETRMPRFTNSSLAILSSPHTGFFRAILRIKVRNSMGILGRPARTLPTPEQPPSRALGRSVPQTPRPVRVTRCRPLRSGSVHVSVPSVNAVVKSRLCPLSTCACTRGASGDCRDWFPNHRSDCLAE